MARVDVIVHQVAVPLGYTDGEVAVAVARHVKCSPDRVRNVRVTRRSLDARPRNPGPRYVLSVRAEIDARSLPAGVRAGRIEVLEGRAAPAPRPLRWLGGGRPLVVGAGPAGLLAAHVLAEAGARPVLVERGDAVELRAVKVAGFWNGGALDVESNPLYGEGGAGLFSDGKLTARTKDQVRCGQFLRVLVDCGAPASVLVDAEPHLGSDLLMEIVPRIRAGIVSRGGDVLTNARLDRLIIEGHTVQGAVINGQDHACACCIMATGHSARDVYAMLAAHGVALEAKPFAVGVRLEIPQAAIDRAQYGRFAGDPRLGAASFRLTRKPGEGHRACYSFCMCPGGVVIACASEPGMLTTNGMSYAGRSLPCGNAAFLVPVDRSDFPAPAHGALAGIDFQRRIESAAFAAGGGDYSVPASALPEFLNGEGGADLSDVRSCVRAVPADLADILPAAIVRTLRSAIPRMLRELNGVDPSTALLYGAETRSSSPVRIVRDAATGASISTRGLYPAGEGAGYAGGIVSSAIDGIRAAESVLRACPGPTQRAKVPLGSGGTSSLPVSSSSPASVQPPAPSMTAASTLRSTAGV